MEGLLNPVFLVKTWLRTCAPSLPECRGAQRRQTMLTPVCTRPLETLNIPDTSAEASPVRQKQHTAQKHSSHKGRPAPASLLRLASGPRRGGGRGGAEVSRGTEKGRKEAAELGFPWPLRCFQGPGKGQPALGGSPGPLGSSRREWSSPPPAPGPRQGGTSFGWLLLGRGDTSDACEMRPLVLGWPRPPPALQQERRRGLGPSGRRRRQGLFGSFGGTRRRPASHSAVGAGARPPGALP